MEPVLRTVEADPGKIPGSEILYIGDKPPQTLGGADYILFLSMLQIIFFIVIDISLGHTQTVSIALNIWKSAKNC